MRCYCLCTDSKSVQRTLGSAQSLPIALKGTALAGIYRKFIGCGLSRYNFSQWCTFLSPAFLMHYCRLQGVLPAACLWARDVGRAEVAQMPRLADQRNTFDVGRAAAIYPG